MADSKHSLDSSSYQGCPVIYTEDTETSGALDDILSDVSNATKEDVIQLRNMIGEILGKITDMSKTLDQLKDRTEENFGDIKRKQDILVSSSCKTVKDRSTQTGPDLKCIQRQLTEEEDKTKRGNLVFAGLPDK